MRPFIVPRPAGDGSKKEPGNCGGATRLPSIVPRIPLCRGDVWLRPRPADSHAVSLAVESHHGTADFAAAFRRAGPRRNPPAEFPRAARASAPRADPAPRAATVVRGAGRRRLRLPDKLPPSSTFSSSSCAAAALTRGRVRVLDAPTGQKSGFGDAASWLSIVVATSPTTLRRSVDHRRDVEHRHPSRAWVRCKPQPFWPRAPRSNRALVAGVSGLK